MKTISVVIPTYNVAGYLERTLDDLAAQTRDFDLWVVDDQSSDDSAQIATDFAAGNTRFHTAVLPRHAGIGAARNYGLSQVTTEAVVFVDGDDWVSPDFIETLSDLFSGDDIVATATGYSWWRPPTSGGAVRLLDQRTMFSQVSRRGTEVGGYVWNKAFSMEAIATSSLTFDETIPIAEDYLFTSTFVATTPGLYAFDPTTRYTKVNRSGSTIHTASSRDRQLEGRIFERIERLGALIPPSQ